MNPADWVILSIIGLSALLSLLRGFTREAISLAAWVVALAGAGILSPAMSALFADSIEEPAMRELAAFAVLFIVILGAGMLLAHLLGEAVRHSALSVADRFLGLAFGVARGVLLSMVLVVFSGPWLSAEKWWKESRTIPPLAVLGNWTRERAYQLAEVASR